MGMLISVVANPRVTVSGFVDIFLTGPRFVLDALDKLRNANRVRGINLDRAAEIVATLNRADSGIPVEQLRRPNDAQGQLGGALAYLLFYEWIGISKNADRVWLESAARKRL